LTLHNKEIDHEQQKTTINSGKPKQEKGPASNGDSHLAASGELHQIAAGEHAALTTNQSLPISDNQNSLRANPHGPTLLEDFVLREKITHFDHERIPERIVHARATGVHGFFELTGCKPISFRQYVQNYQASWI
jgi:catalase